MNFNLLLTFYASSAQGQNSSGKKEAEASSSSVSRWCLFISSDEAVSKTESGGTICHRQSRRSMRAQRRKSREIERRERERDKKGVSIHFLQSHTRYTHANEELDSVPRHVQCSTEADKTKAIVFGSQASLVAAFLFKLSDDLHSPDSK